MALQNPVWFSYIVPWVSLSIDRLCPTAPLGPQLRPLYGPKSPLYDAGSTSSKVMIGSTRPRAEDEAFGSPPVLPAH